MQAHNLKYIYIQREREITKQTFLKRNNFDEIIWTIIMLKRKVYNILLIILIIKNKS